MIFATKSKDTLLITRTLEMRNQLNVYLDKFSMEEFIEFVRTIYDKKGRNNAFKWLGGNS